MAILIPSPNPPALPIELIIDIIQQAWNLPLSNKARTALFCSFSLVNRAWLSVFIRIALTDVHITSSAFVSHYFYILRDRAPGERDDEYQLIEAGKTASQLCRSITFRIEEKSLKAQWLSPKQGWVDPNGGHESAQAIRNFLSLPEDVSPSLPNLRKITLEYMDCAWGFDDLFEISRLYSFPSQVDHLDVRFTGSARPSRLFLYHYPRHRNALTLSYNPSQSNIRKLSLSRAPTVVILALIEMCSELEDLEIINPFTGLPRVALPSSLRTLRLRGKPLLENSNQVDPWGLAAAIESEGGLFSAGKSQRLEMDAKGNTDYLKRLCDQFGISLV